MTKQMLSKILENMKQFPALYEKVFVLRSYGNLLKSINSEDIEADSIYIYYI